MATAIMEAQLRDALNGDGELNARGAQAAARLPSGVAVERGPDVVCVWHWRAGLFELHVGGSGPVATVETVAEAVRQTRDLVSS
jgi:hypothetical protein